MANIWKAQSKVNNKIKRNNHDLSKKSNISLKFGTLYPVFCKKVFPGDSFSIDTAFNLKLQPVIFPVQTKMRAHMHYFYVRNKNLWTGWEDWITGLRTNEETPHPYLSVRDSDIKTSSIHDFLGVPTSVAFNENARVAFDYPIVDDEESESGKGLSTFAFCSYADIISAINAGIQGHINPFTHNFSSTYNFLGLPLFGELLPSQVLSNNTFSLNSYSALTSLVGTLGSSNPSLVIMLNYSTESRDYTYPLAVAPLTGNEFNNLVYTLTDTQVNYVNTEYLRVKNSPNTVSCSLSLVMAIPFSSVTGVVDDNGYYPVPVNVSYGQVLMTFSAADIKDYSELGIPLFSRELRLNALPYRAYESIYNAFYRNTQVDPLIINGRTEYNKFVEHMGDGADNFNYHLHQRNYELDFLTSALPSPQQGVAPLVGMTALGDITIEDENGITTAKATVDDDGTITDVVVTSPAASIEHQRVAMSLAQFGMNIQDFRNANAYLRLLETSIRKGYRYIENILGHWGVAPKHNILDMPEFIGGFSRDVQVSTVVSNADTLGSDGLSLGDYGGYAQLVGGSKSPVRHFCDDHGFIIGILSVVPTPCYSQLLPKQMIAPTSYLDYYFPEFDQIGYQPITYKEVAPIQSYLDSLTDPNKRLEDTFGYQRPNYDLVGDVDEVHGLFRTEFRNYVINRIFDTRPELGHDFISINPSEINQIFVDTNPDDDCIIGEIGFAVHTKRPVSRVVIPGLGH